MKAIEKYPNVVELLNTAADTMQTQLSKYLAAMEVPAHVVQMVDLLPRYAQLIGADPDEEAYIQVVEAALADLNSATLWLSKEIDLAGAKESE